MYTSIRRYNVKPASSNEIIQRAEKGFVPIISKSPGFREYELLDTGNNSLLTISTFDTQAEAENSNKLAESWVKENLATLVTEPPTIMSGTVGIYKAR